MITPAQSTRRAAGVSPPVRSQPAMPAKKMRGAKRNSVAGRTVPGATGFAMNTGGFAVAAWLAMSLVAFSEDEPARKGAKPRLTVEKIERKLLAHTDIRADKLPLEDFVKLLSQRHQVPIRLDETALKKAGVAPDVPVTATIRNFTLAAALGSVLRDLKLGHSIDAEAGAIVIGEARPAAEAQRFADAVKGRPDVEMGAARVQRMLQRLLPFLRSEINLVNAVCEPTKEQLRRITREGKLALEETAKAQATGGGGKGQDDPYLSIREAVAAAVKSQLSAEQSTRYEDEVRKQAAHRRTAAIHRIVAELDRELVLSAEQRMRLCESLGSRPTDAWSKPGTFGRVPGLPVLPNELVAPLLTEAQRKVWHDLPKSSPVFVGFVDFNLGLVRGEFDDLEDEEGPPDEAEGKAPR